MRTMRSLAMLAALAALAPGAACRATTQEDGVALAIVYDTSGSMKESVPDSAGKAAPKYVIANRALMGIADRIQAFATNPAAASPRKIHTALFVFHNGAARVALPLGPFEAAALRNWARSFANPNGSTPLGNALRAAGQCVLDSPLARKHVLVITDGLNTAGPSPAAVMPKLKQQAEQKQASLGIYFVAFDVAAQQFEPLKKLGATVVGAADEKQLNSQLEFILQRKVLLEEEEPKK